MNRRSFIALAMNAAIAAGCTSYQSPSVNSDDTADAHFRDLGGVYDYLAAQGTAAPRKLEDLLATGDSITQVTPKIESGEYVVIWGVGKLTTGPDAEALLAYEKKAASEGGVVMLRNLTVKKVSAAEFAELRKSK